MVHAFPPEISLMCAPIDPWPVARPAYHCNYSESSRISLKSLSLKPGGAVWVLLCSHLAGCSSALGGLRKRLLYSLKLVCPSQHLWIVLWLHTRHTGSSLCNLRSAALPRSLESREQTRAARLSRRLCHVCFTVQWLPRNRASDVFFLVEWQTYSYLSLRSNTARSPRFAAEDRAELHVWSKKAESHGLLWEAHRGHSAAGSSTSQATSKPQNVLKAAFPYCMTPKVPKMPFGYKFHLFWMCQELKTPLWQSEVTLMVHLNFVYT